MAADNMKLIAPGKWYTEHDENGIPVKAVYDKSYREVFGYESEEEYADAQKKWESRIHPDDAQRVESHFQDVISKHPEGMDYDIEYRIMTKWGYRWFHDYGRCTRREDGSLSHCDGAIFDIQHISDFELQQAHSELRNEVLDYILKHDDEDPFELLKQFGQKIRVLFNCDQFICRDLERTRIMVNSPDIEKEWCVPESYCRQCQHFDAHHPMYKDGYTEMENCKEGWRGIPVYGKCPIKSSLTRIIYCNGKVVGYAAIHYVKDYHQFNDNDRKTFEEFIGNFSLVLSRYETRQELLKAQRQKDSRAQRIAENYARLLSLEDNFISVYDLDLESGKYEMFVKDQADDEGVNSMMVNNGDFFEDTLKNVLLVVHPDDKDELVRVLSRDHMRERLAKEGHFDYCYRLLVHGVTIWAKLRMAYKDAEKRRVIMGTFNADEEMAVKHAEEERHRAILQNNNRIMALEDNLESIYDVELNSGNYVGYVKGDFYQSNVIDKLLDPGDYFADLRENIDAVIFPQDRDELFNLLNREAIKTALSSNDRIEHYYRIMVGNAPVWFKIRVVYKDEAKKSIIIGVFNADKEVKERQNEEQRRQILLNQMAGDDGVFIVNCIKDTRKTIHDSRRGIDNSQEQPGYSDFIKKHIMAHTAEPDRKMMLEVSKPDYMLNRLKTENEFSVRFRDVMTGRPQHFEMKVVKLSDTEVLQTFTNKDREIISNLISSSIERDYFALYGIDLDFGLIQIIKDSPYFPQGGVGATDDYSTSIKRFASYFEGETRTFFERISDVGYLKRRFETENKATFTYKASTGQWVNVTGLVLSRHEDGAPLMFALGFNFSDSLESKVKDAQKQIAEQNERLVQANLRNDLLYEYANATWWSYIINDNDEVIEAKYGDFAKMGVSPEVLQGEPMDFSKCIHPDDREQVLAEFMAAVKDHSGKTRCDTSYRILFANGEYDWVKSTGRIIRHEDGTRELLGVCMNVAETVKEQQTRLLGAVPLSPDILAKANIGMWAFELDEGCPPRMYDDATMLGLVGLDHQVTPEEAYHAWYDNIDKDSYDLVNDAVAKMVAGDHAEVQYPWHYPDGRTIIVRCGGIRNWGYTKGVRIEGTHQDVTETLHFDEEQRKFAQMKHTMNMFFTLSNEYDPIIVVDPDSGEYDWYMEQADEVSINTSMTVHGDNLYKNIGIDSASIIHEEDRAQFRAFYTRENMMKIAQTGETQETENRWFLKLEGRYKWKYNKAVRMMDDSGKALVVIGVIDTTEKKEREAAIERERQIAQQQLQEALAMAQSASRAKTTFLNNMSHDIRTPMNAIIGYTGLAASHIDNKELVQDFLGKIGQSSEHLLSLINDVLDMSRIESGKMNLSENPEKISDIIHTIRDIVQHDIRAKQLDFFVDAVDVNDEDVICDKLRLNQVILNILSNSIKYTPAGGTISMRVTEMTVKENGYATYEFHFKDNGMGMDEEFLKTIFDPFTRVKSSTVSGIQGTGLGMAITKNIIDMMGGSIDIQSEPGKGTEVSIILDFKLQSAPKAPEQIPELHGLRGLVVDDDASACMSIAKMLRDTGMRPEWCTSGKEAVLRAGEGFRIGDMFKVYIIDWLMPDMNGIETTRRIRKVIGDDAPIIILTAYDWSDIEEEAREAGVTAFVSKPMFPSDLHRVLTKCLGNEEAEAVNEAPQYDLNGKRILLVEDNELNREIATAVLEEFGCVITPVEDGDVAVEKMKAANPGDYDLVLMDVQMPRMDGYEATKQIRALGTKMSGIPILAMTANAFEEDRKAALQAGMDEHIAKPIDIDKLRETLAKFL